MIDHSPSFQGLGVIQGDWDRYLGHCFAPVDEEAEADDKDEHVHQAKAKKRRKLRQK